MKIGDTYCIDGRKFVAEVNTEKDSKQHGYCYRCAGLHNRTVCHELPSCFASDNNGETLVFVEVKPEKPEE